jgi:GNAT superfamily N-acetyltransferase
MKPVPRVISGDDWASFRALRLKALADSPDAFGVTLAEAEANPEAVWRDRAAGPGPLLMAFEDEHPVAMGGLYAPENSEEAFVWGMWVDPAVRGQGLGARILRELLDWGRRLDRAVSLHVTEGNDRARRLYEAHAFTSTGEWQPLRDGSEIRVETLRRQRG